ncbi:hypothetical protein CVT24_006129 [Panaeolus cyanescens]|uniref:Uncharacterized protein n=1 Tax=Panaeolus cyanescens TaxID=181874 RepID=A0A409YDS0_9AGAR|nr:hypothetical protein CVT24_006129 [Panaeolus cyanescens]
MTTSTVIHMLSTLYPESTQESELITIDILDVCKMDDLDNDYMAQYFKALRFSTEEDVNDYVPATMSSEIPLARYLRVTPAMAEALKHKQWGLYPRDHQIARLIVDYMTQNLDESRDLIAIDLAFPSKELYQYKLLFWEDVIQVKTTNGERCQSGQTLVYSEVHPVIAMLSAVEFLSGSYHNRERGLALHKRLNELSDPLSRDLKQMVLTIPVFINTFYPFHEEDEHRLEGFRRRAAHRAEILAPSTRRVEPGRDQERTRWWLGAPDAEPQNDGHPSDSRTPPD